MQRPSFETPFNLLRPAKAWEQGVSGALIVRCLIKASGTVQDCCIVKGLPYLERAAIDALQSARVRPVTFNGKPVQVEYTWTLKIQPPVKGDRDGEPLSP